MLHNFAIFILRLNGLKDGENGVFLHFGPKGKGPVVFAQGIKKLPLAFGRQKENQLTALRRQNPITCFCGVGPSQPIDI
ncbi:hypothetical protein GFER_17035 [Geoalkalibacter ferrihydriticus DSM 17813]|uniref:Uncharacterized protein n=1 Tax=Geoalkalibacter ferrihydriticus DSM 17813 TaxID=1121915 RepID=A0A0C2HRJ6_9BACT|nr:hypothetical protein GFER_17035 [Geoalkalibacter ferrihydriticus DSM 17813]